MTAPPEQQLRLVRRPVANPVKDKYLPRYQLDAPRPPLTEAELLVGADRRPCAPSALPKKATRERLYVIEFTMGLSTVGRTDNAARRIDEHATKAWSWDRQLVRAWVSDEVPNDPMNAEGLLVRWCAAHSERRGHSESFKDLPFNDTVTAASFIVETGKRPRLVFPDQNDHHALLSLEHVGEVIGSPYGEVVWMTDRGAFQTVQHGARRMVPWGAVLEWISAAGVVDDTGTYYSREPDRPYAPGGLW